MVTLAFLLIGCGRVDDNSETKVINGIVFDNDVARDPVNLAVVRIWVPKGGQFFTCTATRVSDVTFLTAAHCLQGMTTNPNVIYIKSGFAPTYSTLLDAFELVRSSSHPNYESPGKFDVALFQIKAKDKGRLTKVTVAPVQFSPAAPYQDVDFYGYGCAALSTFADGHKRYGTAFLLDTSVLGSAYRYVNVTPAEGFDPTEAALCQGDSGGPLVQNGAVAGVNAGLDDGYSYFTRLDLTEVQSWYAYFRDSTLNSEI